MGSYIADISQLSLQAPDSIEWDQYQSSGEFMPPPPKGKYMGQAPTAFAFGGTAKGQLSVTIDPIVIQGPTSQGYKVRFTRASVTRWPNKMGSMLGDYLRSNGVVAQPQTNEEYVSLVEATSNRVFPFLLDWEAYDKETGETTKGYDSFPSDGNGGRIPYIITNDGRKVYANARVQSFVSSV